MAWLVSVSSAQHSYGRNLKSIEKKKIIIDTSINVSSVSAVAQQILWNCLIEDPALVLRHFLEKLTVSNRQVSEHLSFRVRQAKELRCLLTSRVVTG